MAKNIKRTILSEKSPRNRHIAWAEPKDENIQLNIFNEGKWRPIAGSGSSTTVTNKYTSDPNAPMLSSDNIEAQLFIIAEKLDINLVRANPEQMEQIFNELKSVKFATPKQGNAVLVDYDLDNNSLTFQCDDGSIITFTNNQGNKVITGLRPDIDGYLIWKTTKDKLPVRGSQEETDPVEPNPGGNTTKSVKSGLLGLTPPTDPSTEEVYTVINNNTGEIVDPLELHKLTNVIWYDYGLCIPFYLMEIYSGPTEEDSLVSTWQCIWGYGQLRQLVAQLQYDYTIIPFDTIYTVNMTGKNSNGDFGSLVND